LWQADRLEPWPDARHACLPSCCIAQQKAKTGLGQPNDQLTATASIEHPVQRARCLAQAVDDLGADLELALPVPVQQIAERLFGLPLEVRVQETLHSTPSKGEVE